MMLAKLKQLVDLRRLLLPNWITQCFASKSWSTSYTCRECSDFVETGQCLGDGKLKVGGDRILLHAERIEAGSEIRDPRREAFHLSWKNGGDPDTPPNVLNRKSTRLKSRH